MGVKDLYKVLQEEAPNTIIELDLDNFFGWRVAIDISILLYRYIRQMGPERWVDGFVSFLCEIKSLGMKGVCVFDGPNPPPEKKDEQARRRKDVERQRKRLAQAEKLRDKIEIKCHPGQDNESQLSEDLQDEVKNILLSTIGKGKRKRRAPVWEDAQDVCQILDEAIGRWKWQTLAITDEYKVTAKKIVETLSLACFQADGEAETLCAYLCINGHVDAVISEDTDVLAYKVPVLLSKIDMSKKRITALVYDSILKHMDMTPKQFTDLCILLSCDYNDRIKGYPPDGKKHKKPKCIGWKNAICMIREYKCIEDCEPYIEDIKPLKYKKCRQLFTIPAIIENLQSSTIDEEHGLSIRDVIPYSRPINERQLEKLLDDIGCSIQKSTIMESWKPANLVFINPNEEVESDSD
jgi:flap endonuclease-1